MYSARILLDSISEEGARLTTMELTFWRPVLAELNTHRMLSKNAASSRAIPVEKMLQRVMDDPAMPVFWGKNQAGMQAAVELEGDDREDAELHWLYARNDAVERAEKLLELGLHKQIVNRLLEPWCWVTVIATATDWNNFFWLRCHRDAQPEIRKVAALALLEYHRSTPELKYPGEWHCPLIQPDERQLWSESHAGLEHMKKVSVARCARISYLTHEGKRDIEKDLELCERLKGGSGGVGHWSPFEHVATPLPYGHAGVRSGNLKGWFQYRKEFEGAHHSTMSPTERERLIEEMHALGVLVEGDR